MSHIDDNIHSLKQLIQFLKNIDPALYQKKSERFLSDGINGHVRHIIDHYDRFFSGLEAGQVDYDNRRRDPDIERELDLALTKLEEFMERLASIESIPGDKQLDVCLTSAADHTRASTSTSTLQRELQYLCLHDVHHFAFMAFIAKLEGAPVSSEFGVAPSTIQHRTSLKNVHRNMASSS